MKARTHTMRTRSMQKPTDEVIPPTAPAPAKQTVAEAALRLPQPIMTLIRRKLFVLARQNLKEKCRPHLFRPEPEPNDFDSYVSSYDSFATEDSDDFKGELDFVYLQHETHYYSTTLDWLILHTPVLASRTYVDHYFVDERHFIRTINIQSPILKHVRFLCLPVLIWSTFPYPRDSRTMGAWGNNFLPLDRKNSLQRFINKCKRVLDNRGLLDESIYNN